MVTQKAQKRGYNGRRMGAVDLSRDRRKRGSCVSRRLWLPALGPGAVDLWPGMLAVGAGPGDGRGA